MTWSVRWALCASLICAVPAAAQVKTDHLLGKYSTTDDGCRDAATQDFEIRRGIVEGPDILCILGATQPTDKGTEAYEARCKEKGEMRLGTLAFDLSGKPERIRIAFPDREASRSISVAEARGRSGKKPRNSIDKRDKLG